jgi:hypothetical protein
MRIARKGNCTRKNFIGTQNPSIWQHHLASVEPCREANFTCNACMGVCLCTCCISTLARLELIRLKRDAFRFLSEWSRFCLRCLCSVRRASLLCARSRLLPPVLMLVFSNGVLRNVTWSPPLSINCKTCVWYKPCTGSPFICVIRSPGLRPASNAGLDCSTSCKTICPRWVVLVDSNQGRPRRFTLTLIYIKWIRTLSIIIININPLNLIEFSKRI